MITDSSHVNNEKIYDQRYHISGRNLNNPKRLHITHMYNFFILYHFSKYINMTTGIEKNYSKYI